MLWYHPQMPMTRAQQKALALQWKNAAPTLRKARHADIRRQDNAAAIFSLGELSRHVLKRSRSRYPSGFIEMYKILARGGARTR
jgi:3'-phosphoadenosine 5'-phosphosulfate sulfotransferase